MFISSYTRTDLEALPHTIVVVARNDMSLPVLCELVRFTGYEGNMQTFASHVAASEHFDTAVLPSLIIFDYSDAADFELLDKILVLASAGAVQHMEMRVNFPVDQKGMEARYENCAFINQPFTGETIPMLLGINEPGS